VEACNLHQDRDQSTSTLYLRDGMQIFVKTLDHQHQLSICLVVCRSLSPQQNANLHRSNSFLRSTKLPSPPRDPYPGPRRIHQRLRGASPWRHANLSSRPRPSTSTLHLRDGMQIFVKTFDHQHTSSPSAWWCADLCLRSRMQIFIVLNSFLRSTKLPSSSSRSIS